MNPYLLFGLLGLGGAGIATVLFAQFIPPVAAWIIAINLSALVMYRADKALAPTNTTPVRHSESHDRLGLSQESQRCA